MQAEQGGIILVNRGLDSIAIDSFMLGFAPDSWDRLAYSLKKNGADLNLAEKIGLIGKARTSGNLIDKVQEQDLFLTKTAMSSRSEGGR